ncbi:MAG: UDP-N-acetylglucosamine 2-epimerase (non-hydrolyzing) [Aquihabitans sp.]
MGDRLRSVFVVIGTRPEAVKLSPVVRELRRRADRFAVTVCVTGQHQELLDQALLDCEIQADLNLDVMRPDQDLASLTARLVTALDEAIGSIGPDIVLVQGDTTSAFCGALAAYYRRTTVGHVEAGLRTGDKYAPFPEEGNRLLIRALADLHFAPTPLAAQRLAAEGVEPHSVFMTGNTAVDALLRVRSRVRSSVPEGVVDLDASLGGGPLMAVTAHRREHFGSDLEEICGAVLDIVEQASELETVVPVHPNPKVRGPVHRMLGDHPRIRLVEPLPYEEFVWLMDRASLIITDSGGVQEEAPSLGTPVLVTRVATERPEGISARNLIVGPNRPRIVREALRILGSGAGGGGQSTHNPYGDGRAAIRIVNALEVWT